VPSVRAFVSKPLGPAGLVSSSSFCEKVVIMKTLTFVIPFVLLGIVSGCSRDTSVNQSNNQQFQDVASGSGYGTVVGYEGYFSPGLGPEGQVSPLPSGYLMSNVTWEAGAPDSSYSRVYLQGKEGDLARAMRVRVTGHWTATARTVGTHVYHFHYLSIDSLQILE